MLPSLYDFMEMTTNAMLLIILLASFTAKLLNPTGFYISLFWVTVVVCGWFKGALKYSEAKDEVTRKRYACSWLFTITRLFFAIICATAGAALIRLLVQCEVPCAWRDVALTQFVHLYNFALVVVALFTFFMAFAVSVVIHDEFMKKY